MATLRPTVSVYAAVDGERTKDALSAPEVFSSPLRPDLVSFVHGQMMLNTRQAYGVNRNAGYQTAAESWGTGRAVARIPRVPGGGTHRAGQAAFGNMCRGGGMFNPTKVWRKWHHKINTTQKRHAVASAVAATALPSLVMARGHKINEVPELPLVVSNEVEAFTRTKDAVSMLKSLGLKEDLDKVVNSKKLRAGKGKARNRRFTMRKGPLVVYSEDNGLVKAFRNIPGVETVHADRLSLTKLCPGGHLGRMTLYTESAMKRLNEIYGTHNTGAPGKKGYTLPRSLMTNSDIHRIINSDEVQSVVRPAKVGQKSTGNKKNPLKNRKLMAVLNPGFMARLKRQQLSSTKGNKIFEKVQERKEKTKKQKLAHKKVQKAWFKREMAAYDVKKVEAADEE